MESQGIPYTKKAKFYNILSISEYSNIYKTFTFYSSEPAIADGIMEKIMNEGDDWMNWNETLRNNVTRAQTENVYEAYQPGGRTHDPNPGTVSHDSHKILSVSY